MNIKRVKRKLIKIKNTFVDVLLRPTCEAVGISRFSRPALFDLEQSLMRYLNFRNGIFVELGANDGFAQSNTYYLEKFMGWTGVLVEPVPHLYEKARKRRPKSQVFNFACTDDPTAMPYIEITDLNLMSFVDDALKTTEEVERQIKVGEQHAQTTARRIRVPAATLTQILDQANVTTIDFLSLDVEGYEAQVLKGLDFTRYAPRYILVETRYLDEVEAVLEPFYERVEQITPMDCLYVHRSTDVERSNT